MEYYVNDKASSQIIRYTYTPVVVEQYGDPGVNRQDYRRSAEPNGSPDINYQAHHPSAEPYGNPGINHQAHHPSPVPYADPGSNHQAHNRGAIRVGRWEAGFCDCFKHCVPNCCMACFCPCVSVAQISDRLGIMSYVAVLIIYLIFICTEQAMISMTFYKGWNEAYGLSDYWRSKYSWSRSEYSSFTDSVMYTFYMWIAAAAHLVAFFFVWHLRAKTRDRFELPGSCCCDCCATYWCMCCSIAQIATHVKSYKPGSCDFGRPDTLPGYPDDDAQRHA